MPDTTSETEAQLIDCRPQVGEMKSDDVSKVMEPRKIVGGMESENTAASASGKVRDRRRDR